MESSTTQLSVPPIVSRSSSQAAVITTNGNVKKAVPFYANTYIASNKMPSVAVAFNLSEDFTLQLNLAMDDISIVGYLENGQITNGFGAKVNLMNFEAGLTTSSSSLSWDGTEEITNSTDVMVDGGFLIAFASGSLIAHSLNYLYRVFTNL